MKYRASRSPLTYLGGLLALYLAIPIGAFLIRLAQPGDRGFGAEGLWSALWTSVASATVSTTIVAVLGIPLAYWLARTKGPLTWNPEKQELASRSARLAYPVRDGIPILLESEARTLTDEELGL